MRGGGPQQAVLGQGLEQVVDPGRVLAVVQIGRAELLPGAGAVQPGQDLAVGRGQAGDDDGGGVMGAELHLPVPTVQQAGRDQRGEVGAGHGFSLGRGDSN